jgi:hypothetical protein
MPQCEVCGNDYDKTMEITRGGETHCAERSGVEGARDRVGA